MTIIELRGGNQDGVFWGTFTIDNEEFTITELLKEFTDSELLGLQMRIKIMLMDRKKSRK